MAANYPTATKERGVRRGGCEQPGAAWYWLLIMKHPLLRQAPKNHPARRALLPEAAQVQMKCSLIPKRSIHSGDSMP